MQGHGCGALGRPQCYLAWEAAAQGTEPLFIFNIHDSILRACCPYALLLLFGQRPGALLPAGRSLALSLVAAAARAGFARPVVADDGVASLLKVPAGYLACKRDGCWAFAAGDQLARIRECRRRASLVAGLLRGFVGRLQAMYVFITYTLKTKEKP